MTLERFLVSDLTSSSYLETLFGTGIRFYLWHFYMFDFYTLLAFRTGGNLWSLVGNQDFYTEILKRSAKVRDLVHSSQFLVCVAGGW